MQDPVPSLQVFLVKQIIQSFSMPFCCKVGDFKKGMFGRSAKTNWSYFFSLKITLSPFRVMFKKSALYAIHDDRRKPTGFEISNDISYSVDIILEHKIS